MELTGVVESLVQKVSLNRSLSGQDLDDEVDDGVEQSDHEIGLLPLFW